MTDIRIRRVYDPPSPEDGIRVLVDRLWPRGLTKEAARIDEWPKVLTPSTELRRWFHAGRGGFEEFCQRYEDELAAPEAAEALDALRGTARTAERLTLLTASKDPSTSHAVVLEALLAEG
jgi:uncharacterized protein YeaO (DUF488 family)